MISIVYATYRPGGYDMLASSLSHQDFRDFETICVDDYPNRSPDTIRAYLEIKGVPDVKVVRSKAKCFPQLSNGAINAWNTGFLLARGDVVMMLSDFSWFPPDFLSRVHTHQEGLKTGQLIVMPGHFWSKEDKRNETSQFGLWDHLWDGHPRRNGCTPIFDWVPEGLELACTAFPIGILDAINGFPEWTDGYAAAPLSPVQEAIVAAGGSWYVDRENFVHYVDHRQWAPSSLWHAAKRPDNPLIAPGTPNCFNLKGVRLENYQGRQL